MRPVSNALAMAAALALAIPPVSLPAPAQAQERLNRDQVVRICTELLQTDDRVALARCAIEQFEARGQAEAAAAARLVLEDELARAEQPAPAAPLTREEAIRICVDRLNSQDRQTVGACVADELERDGQPNQAANVRAQLEAERREAAEAAERAAAEAAEAERREAERQAQEARETEERIREAVERERREAEREAARAAEEAERERRQAERRAARQLEQRQAEEAAAAERERREAEAAAAAERIREEERRRAEAEAAAAATAPLSRAEAIQSCAADLRSRDRQIVGACVVERLAADGQTDLANRIRDNLRAEREAEAQAAAQREAEAERRRAEAEARAAADAPITREDAREACRAQLDNPGRTAMRRCIADTLEADGQIEAAERIRDRMPDSRVADEVAARGEPELTPQQRRAAELAARALEARADRAAAAAAAQESARGEVTEETVRREDTRASFEDFDTRAVVTDDDDDDGLSTAQKFALGALGALAVGTLLNNRDRIVSNSGDRVVVQRDDGELEVLKDDDALLRQEGNNVRTETFDDGSTRTTVTRDDGSRVVTVRDASLRVLRRTLIEPDGREFVLIDDTGTVEPVDVTTLPPAQLTTTRGGTDPLDPLGTLSGGLASLGTATDDPLAAALRREAGFGAVDRRFSLNQIRTIPEVRALAPAMEVADVTFASGSAAIVPEQARNLTDLAREVLAAIRIDPTEVFLVEGHTDAVGDAAYNLALSDRRAESLALALNEYFGVPVENMVVQGYGEEYLKVPTLEAEQANRRATLRRITPLLRVAAAN